MYSDDSSSDDSYVSTNYNEADTPVVSDSSAPSTMPSAALANLTGPDTPASSCPGPSGVSRGRRGMKCGFACPLLSAICPLLLCITLSLSNRPGVTGRQRCGRKSGQKGKRHSGLTPQSSTTRKLADSRVTDAKGFTKRETGHARNARTALGQSGVTPPLGRAKLRPHAAGGQTPASRRGTP